ncbi:hypothetical protein [Chitinophaga niastensis]|uniref:hypothetical protein n=1 Tax=Chitinophaga niastensis TaxID=536980 RepID=UPI0011B1C9B6|nr:hypothetical protein [Chitinophaga niastensis]
MEGEHERMISPEIFLKVNNIHKGSVGYGVPHKKEDSALPLKVFIKCDTCHQPFTGYVVKAKGLWYYKCRTDGCKCNKSAKRIHELFEGLLNRYCVREELIESLKSVLITEYNGMNKGNLEQQGILTSQLKEINKKIDSLEESRFVLKEMSQETFDKFYPRYIKERENIAAQLDKCKLGISNPEEAIQYALSLSSKLPMVWHSSDVGMKEKLQKLIFPEGIVYDRKNEALRTGKVNEVFALIAGLSGNTGSNEKGTNHTDDDLSPFADRTGLH